MIGLIFAAAVTTGTWSMQTTGGKTQLDMRWSDETRHHVSEDGRAINPADYGIADIMAQNGHITFKQHREAGDFSFEGWMQSGSGGGTYTFTENEPFFAELRRRGYAFDEMSEKIGIADVDVTLEYINSIEAVGYHPEAHNLVAFRALNVTPQWIKEMKDAGLAVVEMNQVIPLRALRVDGAYLRDLASVGYTHLAARDLVTLKAMKIDSAYVKYLQAHGFKNITIQQLIQMKAMKV